MPGLGRKVLAVGAGWSMLFFMGALPLAAAGPASKVRTPDITGKTPAQAGQVAAKAGLKFHQVNEGRPAPPGSKPVYMVLRQVPPPGQTVPRQATLVGYVRAMLPVPSLVGMHVNKAREVLQKAGFRWKILPAPLYASSPGVFRQQPSAHTNLVLDSVVTLQVYKVKPKATPGKIEVKDETPSVRTSQEDLRKEGFTRVPDLLPNAGKK